MMARKQSKRSPKEVRRDNQNQEKRRKDFNSENKVLSKNLGETVHLLPDRKLLRRFIYSCSTNRLGNNYLKSYHGCHGPCERMRVCLHNRHWSCSQTKAKNNNLKWIPNWNSKSWLTLTSSGAFLLIQSIYATHSLTRPTVFDRFIKEKSKRTSVRKQQHPVTTSSGRQSKGWGIFENFHQHQQLDAFKF